MKSRRLLSKLVVAAFVFLIGYLYFPPLTLKFLAVMALGVSSAITVYTFCKIRNSDEYNLIKIVVIFVIGFLSSGGMILITNGLLDFSESEKVSLTVKRMERTEVPGSHRAGSGFIYHSAIFDNPKNAGKEFSIRVSYPNWQLIQEKVTNFNCVIHNGFLGIPWTSDPHWINLLENKD
jgi:hypothetical protein